LNIARNLASAALTVGWAMNSFFCRTGEIALLHQGFEHHHQVDIGFAQFVSVHWRSRGHACFAGQLQH
jgi:hypothetical protein